MKTVLAACTAALTLAASASWAQAPGAPAAQPEAGASCTPVGTWQWFNGARVAVYADGSAIEFRADGSRTNDARWVGLGGGRYRIEWRQGGWVDALSLSADGRSLEGRNQVGSPVRGSCVAALPMAARPVSPPAAAAPAAAAAPPAPAIARAVDGEARCTPVGTWQWMSGGIVSLAADGSAVETRPDGSRSNDARWVSLGGDRYRLSWRLGGWVDTLTLSADGRTVQGSNNAGAPVRGTCVKGAGEVMAADEWFVDKKVVWVSAEPGFGSAAYIQEVTPSRPYDPRNPYSPIARGPDDAVAHVRAVLGAALLANRGANIEIGKDRFVQAASFSADPAVPVPPRMRIDSVNTLLPASQRFDGHVKAVYATAHSRMAHAYIDGRIARAEDSTASPGAAAYQGWVRIEADPPWAAAGQFTLACQAAALGHAIRLYSDRQGRITQWYLWSR